MMLATALRKSILQAAIAGQLTEQRKDDGDARDLLAAIRKEKAQLVRTGKLKKERALPEIDEDDVPFEVPENWCWTRLGDVASWAAGATPDRHQPKYYTGGSIPWLKTGDLTDGIITDVPEQITELALKETSVKLQPPGTVLIAMYGATIGKLGITQFPLTTNQACCGAIPFHGIFNEYLFFFLMSQKASFIKQGAGGAQPNISRTKIIHAPIPIPPYAEQLQIVKRIKKLLAEIDKLEADEQELDALETAFPTRMKSSLLLAAMRGELTEREPGDGDARDLLKSIEREKQRLVKEKKLKREKPLPPVAEEDVPFEIPSNWCWVRLTELGAFSSGKTPNKLDQRNWNNGTYSWITSKDMKKKYLSDSMIHITEFAKNNLREYPAGTMLLVVRSGILKRLLPIAILEKPSTINQDIKAYELFLPKMLDFVYYAIKAFEPMILHDYRKQVTTVDSLKFDEFSKGMPLPLPPLAEQRRIVARLEELLGAVEG